MGDPRVLGCDLSLTATGVCLPDGSCQTVKSKQRGMARLAEIRAAVAVSVWADHEADRSDVVMLEGYSFASRNGGEHLGELGGVVRLMLWEQEVPYVEIPPSTMKKFATGKGNAGKDEVLAAAVRAGSPCTNNNEADAWWLHMMGRYAEALQRDLLEFPVGSTKFRDEAVAKIEWPAALWREATS